ncbi:MAG: ArnT family glycosyltransferase, partial [Desulfobulbales bacterium]
MKAKTFSISQRLPVLFVLVFLGLFAHLGYMPLLDGDEGTYSEVTREMLQNKDFASVRLNGIPFPHKPPLFYWAQAASVKFFGLNEFGLRLPSAIAALLWIGSIFLFTRRYYDTRSGWYAGLFMGSSLLVTLVGRAATPEAITNLFLTLALLNIFRFYHDGSRRHIYWSFMFGALGVLTKGAIAILLPVSVSLIFFTIKKRGKDILRLSFSPVGLIVAGLIVIPWYLGEFMLHGKAYLADLLMLPGLDAPLYGFVGSSLPYYTYPLVILLGVLPFSGVLLKGFLHINRLWSDDLVKFLLTWFFLAIILLPLTEPRSVSAITYCLPPLFIIMARVADDFRHPINIIIWPLLFVALLLLGPYMVPFMTDTAGDAFIRSAVTENMHYFNSFYTVTLGILLLLLAALPFIRAVPTSIK